MCLLNTCCFCALVRFYFVPIRSPYLVGKHEMELNPVPFCLQLCMAQFTCNLNREGELCEEITFVEMVK
jgi:hypothetical protein